MSHYNKTKTKVKSMAKSLAWEIKYWADVLGCSEIEVIPAVKEMLGLSSTKKNAAVTDHLKRRYKMA
jgi:hypothetical protein